MDLEDRVRRVREQVAEAAVRSGLPADSITLVAVSKGHSPESVRRVSEQGLTLFAESKVQEAKIKISMCPGKFRWHMIGHLQSNKARDAAFLFEMIQSVDSFGLAEELNKAAGKAGKTLKILLEVNIAGESTKFGYRPDAVLADLTRINSLPNLEIHGLMGMAPWTNEVERVRPLFRELKELHDRCSDGLGAPLPVLSMGMSGDFEVAIEEGSTMVRVGTALFGAGRSGNKSAAGG